MLDGFDIVLLCPPDQPSAQLRRKLEAVARRHGGVLVVAGDWPGAQSRLLMTDAKWIGIGAGPTPRRLMKWMGTSSSTTRKCSKRLIAASCARQS